MIAIAALLLLQPEWWATLDDGKVQEDVQVNGTETQVSEAAAAEPAPAADAEAPPAPAPAQEVSEPAAAAEEEEGAKEAPPAAPAPPKSRSVAEVVVEGSWVCPYIATPKKPPPRYEHAVALVGSKMILVGGNYGGRYLSDAWALNLEDLTWTQLASSKGGALPPSTAPVNGDELPHQVSLPPVAGHAAVAWENSVLVVGGHTKAKDAVPQLPVRILDPASGIWSLLETSVAEGNVPPKPRGGHSVSAAAGTGAAGRVLACAWLPKGLLLARQCVGMPQGLCVCLVCWRMVSWSAPPCHLLACLLVPAHPAWGVVSAYLLAGPSRRAAHTPSLHALPLCTLQATIVGDKVYVFGGEDALRRPMGELVVLDLSTREWSVPETSGTAPSPRSAHATASYMGRYILVFGGGSVAHCFNDLYVLDTQTLEWSKPHVEAPVPPPRAGARCPAGHRLGGSERLRRVHLRGQACSHPLGGGVL